MIALMIGILRSLSAFFRCRYSLTLELLALSQQLGVLKRKNLVLDRESWIEHFGFCSVGHGLDGAAFLSSSSRKPLLLGIGPVFVCSGAFDHNHGDVDRSDPIELQML